MPEPVSYYRDPNICATEPEGPPDPPEKVTTSSATGAQSRAADAPAAREHHPVTAELVAHYERGYQQLAAPRSTVVLNAGIAISAEGGVGPESVGGGFAFGMYFDTSKSEIGFYERREERSGTGLYAGMGFELGVTDSRKHFDGESDVRFTEGGELGKLSEAHNATSGSVSIGFGKGAAIGDAHTETTTTSVDQLDDWGPNPMTRRGP